MTNNTGTTKTKASSSTWQLNALTHALGDLTLTVDDRLSVGRGSDNDVVLGSKRVSRNHALLSVLDGRLYVKDLDSSNGTFINEQRIEGKQPNLLQANDTIGFAGFDFVIHPATAQSPIAVDEVEEYIIHTTDDDAVTAQARLDDASSVTQDSASIAALTAHASTEQASALTDEPVSAELHDTPAPVPSATPAPTPTAATPEQVIQPAKQAAATPLSGTAPREPSATPTASTHQEGSQATRHSEQMGTVEKKESGGWFLWMFAAIVVIAVAMWWLNKGVV